jgi:hypothetical protein
MPREGLMAISYQDEAGHEEHKPSQYEESDNQILVLHVLVLRNQPASGFIFTLFDLGGGTIRNQITLVEDGEPVSQ